MDWIGQTGTLFSKAGVELLDDGINTVIRGKNYFEVLNVVLRTGDIPIRDCPEITDIAKWWRSRGNLLEFIALEQANYLGISKDLSNIFAERANDISPTSRRYCQITTRSMLPNYERADFPTCVPVVHFQFRKQTAYLTAYFRSLDINLMRLDCAWLLWLGKTYAQYAEYQFKEPFRWVKLTLFIGNLHRSEKSDGGIE